MKSLLVLTILVLCSGIHGTTTDETSSDQTTMDQTSYTQPTDSHSTITDQPISNTESEPLTCYEETDNTRVLDKGENQPCEYGECVPYYLCLNGSIITDGAGILDSRLGTDEDPEPKKHPCPDFFDTCCTLKVDQIPDLPSDNLLITKTPIHEKCGVRNAKGAAFELAAHDHEAQFGEFPWVVAIIQKLDDTGDVVNLFKCGGSLIHPSVVLTTAHSILGLNPTSLMIRAGEWDTQTTDEPYPHQDRAVVEILIHEHYRPGAHFNDIALLFLDKPVELKENVNTVCLPPQDYLFDHQICHATGWGKDKFGKDGLFQVIMKRVELPVVPHLECQSKLRETRLGRHFLLDHSFLCAGGERGVDTCTGDGGSPLNCESKDSPGQYYEAGMVAWGIGCLDPIPGVYANVAKFRGWIDSVFERKQLDTKYYNM